MIFYPNRKRAWAQIGCFAFCIEFGCGVSLGLSQVAMERLRPAIQRNETSQKLKQQQVRGLIQNELTLVKDLGPLTDSQIQAILDLAETEWHERSLREITRSMDQHVHGAIDFDGLVERSMLEWTRIALPKEIADLYELELQDRQKFRNEALLNKMLIWLQEKLSLSSEQVDRVAEVLRTKWKDRWFRSIEATYENESLLPEINKTWLDEILTPAQRTALAVRAPSSKPVLSTANYPTLPLETRFSLGALTSKVSIALRKDEESDPGSRQPPVGVKP